MRGWWLCLGVGWVACGGRAAPVPEPVVSPVGKSVPQAPPSETPEPLDSDSESWQPTASQEGIYRMLSVRDPEPGCASVAEASPTPALDLLALVDHAKQPPWVGMRAASCLVSDHLDEVQEHVVGWMRTEATYGLALMTIRRLDGLPEEVAVAVVSAGLGGPADTEVRDEAAKDSRESVRALVTD